MMLMLPIDEHSSKVKTHIFPKKNNLHRDFCVCKQMHISPHIIISHHAGMLG